MVPRFTDSRHFALAIAERARIGSGRLNHPTSTALATCHREAAHVHLEDSLLSFALAVGALGQQIVWDIYVHLLLHDDEVTLTAVVALALGH